MVDPHVPDFIGEIDVTGLTIGGHTVNIHAERDTIVLTTSTGRPFNALSVERRPRWQDFIPQAPDHEFRTPVGRQIAGGAALA